MSKIALLGCFALLVTACHRKADETPAESAVEKATPEACQKACEHVADLQKQAVAEAARLRTHEMEEMLEASEIETKKNIARLKVELATPRPKYDDSLDRLRKLSPEARKQLRQTYELEGVQLKQQQQQAIKTAEEELAKSKASLDAAKKGADGEVKKAHDDQLKLCLDDCVQHNRPAKAVECMLEAQNPEDVQPCQGTGWVAH